MEQRYSMKFFVEEYHGKEDPEVNYFYLEGDDNVIGGREVLLEDKKITYYFFPTAQREALLFLYVGDDVFDEVVDNIDEYNEEGIINAFPLFIKALMNGAQDNYSQTALIKLPHVNGNGSFWCFATKIENVDFSDLDNDYVINKLSKLYSDTIDIFNQIDENDVSFWDQLKGAGKAGYDGWKLAKTALTLGGILFGLDLSGGD